MSDVDPRLARNPELKAKKEKAERAQERDEQRLRDREEFLRLSAEVNEPQPFEGDEPLSDD